jgi:hypothetical protein
MAVDWVINLPCEPKETLGSGDFLAGTDDLLARLKAGNQAELIAEIARQEGESPEGQVRDDPGGPGPGRR